MKVSVKLSVSGILNGGHLDSFRAFMNAQPGFESWGRSGGQVVNNLSVPQAVFSGDKIIPMLTRDNVLSFVTPPMIFNDAAKSVYNTIRCLSPDGLLRGYLIAGESFKKTSALQVYNFLSDSPLLPHQISLAVGSTRGPRDETSYRHSVVLPKTTYASEMFFNIDEMLFMSVDNLYDRQTMTADLLANPGVRTYFKSTYGADLPEPQYYIKGTAITQIPERGVVLPVAVAKKVLLKFFADFAAADFRKSDALGELTEFMGVCENQDFNLTNVQEAEKFVDLLIAEYQTKYTVATKAQIENATSYIAEKTKKDKEKKKRKNKDGDAVEANLDNVISLDEAKENV